MNYPVSCVSLTGYLGRIPKDRILDAVREATSPEVAATLVNLKKGECAKAAEKKLAGTNWLPEPLRTSTP
jgi:ParB family chromosome partitioning protein